MSCEACGCATKVVSTTEFTGNGPFCEEWECANGHKGFVSGREEEPPANWTKAGSVFKDNG